MRTNVNVNARCTDGITALYGACLNGHVEVVQFLVHEGKADVNVKTNRGCTALYDACQNGHFEVVKCLVRDGITTIVIH